jgi:Tol biopolymer transport system component
MKARILLTCALLLAANTGALAQDLVPQYPRTILITFDPLLESEGGMRLHTRGGWSDPVTLAATYSSDLAQSSHDLMQYRRMVTLRADEFPLHTDGYRYTDASYVACLTGSASWHMTGTDYKSQVRDYDLARKVDAGMIDEVLIHAPPYTGYYESTMCGRGGYWCNSGPQQRIACTKIFIMMGFNYERGVGEMLEDYGHRSESILWHTYGSWYAQPTHAWNRFSLYDKQLEGMAACGNVHYAPNSQSDYDWGNSTYVWSYCDDWLDNYPNLQNTQVWVNCSEWGNGDMRQHHKWWFERFPHVPGSLTEYSMTRLNNWWEYVQDFNTHAESGGDFLAVSPPPATPYPGNLRQLTSNATDDWTPRVNAAGRAVWSGLVGLHYQIFAANLDGTGLVQITNNAFENEAPQINASGRIVWQAFDGQDYEILSANADGTGLVQITSNTVQDWQPQLNNAGRIVWSHFDGATYQVMSANADGSGGLQLTSTSGSGRPRDNVWPQINNQSPARVVWMGYDGTNWDICSANADGSNLVNVSNNTLENEYPMINDAGRVVWHAYHDSVNTEIWSCNATGGTAVQLSSNGEEDWHPRINNAGQVVWMARVGGDWEIYTRPANAATPAVAVTSNSTHDEYPVIDDNGRIAWQGWDGHDWEIYARLNGVIYQITSNDYDDRWPSLANLDAIVWHAESTPGSTGPTSEIWAAGTASLDITPPTVLSVQAQTATRVKVRFSEPLDPISAQTPGNYAITPARAVTAAQLTDEGAAVLLTTATLAENTSYTLELNNVTDTETPANPIAAHTQVPFTYVVYHRVTDGLLALYAFEEGSGTTVHDTSGVSPACDLTIEYPANTAWTTGGLEITAGPYTRLIGPTANTKFATACSASDQVTLEAWIAPAQASQVGPARILTLSNSASVRNFTLGHGDSTGNPGDKYDVRLRTATSDTNGRPSLTTAAGAVTTLLQHVVFTRDAAGMARLYIDGEEVVADTRAGNFDTWNSAYRLALANEVGYYPTNGWLGEYRLAAVYSRALTAAEVAQNYGAGPDPVSAPVVCAGDANCDNAVNWRDIDYFIAGMNDNMSAWAALFPSGPSCAFANLDSSGDGIVNWRDIDPLIAKMNTTCP